MKHLRFIPLALVTVGAALMIIAHFKIKAICEKYPIEVQMEYPACASHGPWPQRKLDEVKE